MSISSILIIGGLVVLTTGVIATIPDAMERDRLLNQCVIDNKELPKPQNVCRAMYKAGQLEKD